MQLVPACHALLASSQGACNLSLAMNRASRCLKAAGRLLRHQRHRSILRPHCRVGQHGPEMIITLSCRHLLQSRVHASLQTAAADQDGDEEGSGDEADKVSKRKRKQEARLKVADLKTVSLAWLYKIA